MRSSGAAADDVAADDAIAESSDVLTEEEGDKDDGETEGEAKLEFESGVGLVFGSEAGSAFEPEVELAPAVKVRLETKSKSESVNWQETDETGAILLP